MLQVAVLVSLAMLGVALLLNLWRLFAGPDLPDRVLALDTMYINTIAVIVLFDVYLDTAIYFEAALIIAMMGFVGTVALTKYVLRGDIIE